MPKNLLLTIIFFLTTNIAYAAFPPPATGNNGIVVTADQYATMAGVKILQQGGNAIDAAVAVGYALAVSHPCCGNLGGGGFMLIHLKNGKNTFLDFRETAPAAIKQSLFLKKNTFNYNALLWGIPGTVKGLNAALSKYGTFPLKRVIHPAIILANRGYKLTTQQMKLLNFLYAEKNKPQNLKNLLYKNGKPYKVNSIFRQPQLGKTLKLIAQQGDAGFYQGKVANAIISASKKHGGVLSLQDLNNYQVKWRTPITCVYHGYNIITAPPPGSGITICQILQILNTQPLQQWGFLSVKSIHDNVEAMRYAFADRNTYLGDPDCHHIPIQWLLSKKHIASLRNKIKPNKAGTSVNLKINEQPQTTHYSIIDKWGNAVAVTYSLNGYFGSHLIPGHTGFFMNNTMDDFTLQLGKKNIFGLVQGAQNLVAPKHRPLSSMSPTIVTQQGRLRFILGTPGGSTIITQIVLAIENLINYKMNIAQAIDQCRYHMQGIPDKVSVEPFCFSPDTIDLLNKMGYNLKPSSTYFSEHYWGGMAGIAIKPQKPFYRGAMDIRRPNGLAKGY